MKNIICKKGKVQNIMFTSKDIGLIIVLAVLHFVVTLSVGQLARTVTGIPGISYAFTVFHAVITAFSVSIYSGARWRFLFQTTLYTFLIVPTSVGGVPFDLVTKSGLIFNALVVDAVMVSFYGFFKERKRQLLWVAITTTVFWMLNPLFGIAIKSLILFPPDYVASLISTVMLLYPVIIAESIAGALIGYVIYRRVTKIHS
jgi:hypothetical protein